MEHYSVLLVDDDRRHCLDVAEREFPRGQAIRVLTAPDKESADRLVKAEFFNMALVDPGLHKEDTRFEGFVILKGIKENRPSCERFILTDLARNTLQRVMPISKQLHPTKGVAQGLQLRADPVDSFIELIREKANTWLTNALKVEGADTVADRLRELYKERHKRTKVAVCVDEIDYLASRVFGQGESWNLGQDGLGIRRVKLELISRQGFSLAAVVRAMCFSSDDVPGILCVLKFAPREYVQQELVRYSQYVRYRLDVHHRTELLGWVFADNLGVLCYNFASVTSLSDLFLREEPGFFDALSDLFSPGKKSWYNERSLIKMSRHFNDHYSTNLFDIQEKLNQTYANLEARFESSYKQNQLIVDGVTLDMPRGVLDRAVFNSPSPGCIVHGDLHCDNVLVKESNEPMLIDYYKVTVGPRVLDFASLEASIRLFALLHPNEQGEFLPDPRSDQEVFREILQLVKFEEAVWRTVWHPDDSVVVPAKSFWMLGSIHLGRLAKSNSVDLTEEEYAATCLLWAMRLFRPESMPERSRVRLLVWISCLVRVIKNCSD
jgi:hypothetical protein